MKKAIYVCIILAVGKLTAFFWGAAGHETIAKAAVQLIQNDKTKAAVAAILANTGIYEIMNIDAAATWPDDIRQSRHPGEWVSVHQFRLSFPQRQRILRFYVGITK